LQQKDIIVGKCVPTSFDVIQSRFGYAFSDGKRLNLQNNNTNFMINKNITNQLDSPHVAYASIIKRILNNNRNNLVSMNFDVKHSSLVNIIGSNNWKYLQRMCHDVLICYNTHGIESKIYSRILSDDVAKYDNAWFAFDRHSSKKQYKNSITI
jgi:hypothetical protein